MQLLHDPEDSERRHLCWQCGDLLPTLIQYNEHMVRHDLVALVEGLNEHESRVRSRRRHDDRKQPLKLTRHVDRKRNDRVLEKTAQPTAPMTSSAPAGQKKAEKGVKEKEKEKAASKLVAEWTGSALPPLSPSLPTKRSRPSTSSTASTVSAVPSTSTVPGSATTASTSTVPGSMTTSTSTTPVVWMTAASTAPLSPPAVTALAISQLSPGQTPLASPVATETGTVVPAPVLTSGSQCPACKRFLSNANVMIQHAVHEHGAEIRGVELRSFKEERRTDMSKMVRRTTCEFCGLRFSTTTDYFLHQTTTHRADLLIRYSGDKTADKFVLLVETVFQNATSFKISIAVRRKGK